MATPDPENIGRDELLRRLGRETTYLTGSNLAWWTEHCVPLFAARHWQMAHFVVAAAGDDVIFFASDEDEFGVAKRACDSDLITECGLVGDLTDAVEVIQRITTESGRLSVPESAYSVY